MVSVPLPVALLALALSGTAARAQPAEPVFSDTGPDASAYGADRGFSVPSPGTYPPRQEDLIGWHTSITAAFSALDESDVQRLGGRVARATKR